MWDATETQLIQLIEDLASNLVSGKMTDLILLHFSKTFPVTSRLIYCPNSERMVLKVTLWGGTGHSWLEDPRLWRDVGWNVMWFNRDLCWGLSCSSRIQLVKQFIWLSYKPDGLQHLQNDPVNKVRYFGWTSQVIWMLITLWIEWHQRK